MLMQAEDQRKTGKMVLRASALRVERQGNCGRTSAGNALRKRLRRSQRVKVEAAPNPSCGHLCYVASCLA